MKFINKSIYLNQVKSFTGIDTITNLSSNIRTEGDSLMAGAYGNSLRGKLNTLVSTTGNEFTNTAVGGSNINQVLDRIVDPVNTDLLGDITIIWDGSPNGLTTVSEYVDIIQECVDALKTTRYLIIPPITPYGSSYAGSTGEQVYLEMLDRFPNNTLHWNLGLVVDSNIIRKVDYTVGAASDCELNVTSDTSFNSTRITNNIIIDLEPKIISGKEYTFTINVTGTSPEIKLYNDGVLFETLIGNGEHSTTFTQTGVVTIEITETGNSLELNSIDLTRTDVNSIDHDMFESEPSDPWHLSSLGCILMAELIYNELKSRGWINQQQNIMESVGGVLLHEFSDPNYTPEHNDIIVNEFRDNVATLTSYNTDTDLKLVLYGDSDKHTIETTLKGGLHYMSTHNPADGNPYGLAIELQNNIFDYILNSPDEFYISVWAKTTRDFGDESYEGANPAVAPMPLVCFGRNTSNYKFFIYDRKVETGVFRRTSVVSGYRGNINATPITNLLCSGALGGWRYFNVGAARSNIFYRIFIENTTQSGRTQQELDELDSFAFERETSLGGKFYDDKYSDPIITKP